MTSYLLFYLKNRQVGIFIVQNQVSWTNHLKERAFLFLELLLCSSDLSYFALMYYIAWCVIFSCSLSIVLTLRRCSTLVVFLAYG